MRKFLVATDPGDGLMSLYDMIADDENIQMYRTNFDCWSETYRGSKALDIEHDDINGAYRITVGDKHIRVDYSEVEELRIALNFLNKYAKEAFTSTELFYEGAP